MKKKCCLIVIDGWGYNEKEIAQSRLASRGIEGEDMSNMAEDGIISAGPVFMQSLTNTYYSSLLYAHGTYVGLSSNEIMGNSEVGHLTIGAGRVVEQDSVRIRNNLKNGNSDVIRKKLGQHMKSIHILGILSDGCIHGNWLDIRDVAKQLSSYVDTVYIHTISDGRDTKPSRYLTYFNSLLEELPVNVWVVSVAGRFYAMDRDKREERTEKAFREIIRVQEASAKSMKDNKGSLSRERCHESIRCHIEKSYTAGITDEFIEPFCANGWISNSDTVVITNYRVDRLKQIYAKLVEDKYLKLKVFSMTRIRNEQDTAYVLFERPPINNTLGDLIEEKGLTQARIAETEKKAHVTFFFDGGRDIETRKKERRLIHPSKKVATYDLAPKMSASEIANSIMQEIIRGTDFVLANFANCDMVGHTGSLEATRKAVQEVDKQIQRIYEVCKEHEYNLIITADHGNAEIMQDSQGIVKSHTTNRVPVIVITKYVKMVKTLVATEKTNIQHSIDDNSDGFVFKNTDKKYTLSSIAPTVLEIMGISEMPKEMTGISLLKNVK